MTHFIKMVILGLITILLLTGIFIFMRFQKNTGIKFEDIKLEKFDDIWGLYGDPVLVEQKFNEILPQAETLKDKSIYLQILSQIALAQALQKKFNEAHQTLNHAEAQLSNEYDLARVRILLERGRVFQQSEKISEALNYFEQSFELSKKNKHDYHTINAAHMIAIVVKETADKIKWNQLAIDMATSAEDKQASIWQGPLYNNLGQNYLEEKQFEKALLAFQKALELRQKEGYAPNIRFAKWSIARTLRSLDKLDEALAIQLILLKEYETISASGKFDLPVIMFNLTRGWIYEEIAEIYNAKSKIFANLAYDDLSRDAMFCVTSPERLERLKQIKQ